MSEAGRLARDPGPGADRTGATGTGHRVAHAASAARTRTTRTRNPSPASRIRRHGETAFCIECQQQRIDPCLARARRLLGC